MVAAPSAALVASESNAFRITFAPLSLDEVYALANDPANGAVVVMSGMVRNNTDGFPVVALEYQAYEPMALEVFRPIADQIRQTWPDATRVVIHHRTGKLTVGEISAAILILANWPFTLSLSKGEKASTGSA